MTKYFRGWRYVSLGKDLKLYLNPLHSFKNTGHWGQQRELGPQSLLTNHSSQGLVSSGSARDSTSKNKVGATEKDIQCQAMVSTWVCTHRHTHTNGKAITLYFKWDGGSAPLPCVLWLLQYAWCSHNKLRLVCSIRGVGFCPITDLTWVFWRGWFIKECIFTLKYMWNDHDSWDFIVFSKRMTSFPTTGNGSCWNWDHSNADLLTITKIRIWQRQNTSEKLSIVVFNENQEISMNSHLEVLIN